MCKVLMLTKTTKLKNRKLVVETIARHLLKDHKDGFGYTIQGVKGPFGERTTKTEFKSRWGTEKLEITAPIFNECNNRFGTPSQGHGGALFHGRTSTNDLSLLNTHPINKNNWSLIHNGVVTNHGPEYKNITTNDTEHLIEYLSTIGMSAIEQNITGYYAIGAIDPIGNLHIIRDNIAQLHVAYNKTLDCFIFGTTEKLINDVCTSLNWVIGPIESVKSDIHLVYDTQGKLIHNASIAPRGFSNVESIHANKSLGRTIFADDFSASDNQFQAWRDEVLNADAGYTFFDWTGREMSYAEFMACDELTKMDCKVVRPDGTEVDADDYYTEKLA